VDDRPTMERLIDLGIDGIMTDDPRELEDLIDDRGLH
jgi:glycerophosphoryl diester phosphodiesterase